MTASAPTQDWQAAPLLGQAITLLQAGQVAAAQSLCRKIIERDPRHADAFHVLGVATLSQGDCGAGATLIRRSLEINPGQPHVLCSLGNALRDLRQPAEALVHYRQALQLTPKFAGAIYGEGNALLDLNRLPEAVESYDRALTLAPDYPEAYLNRGNALLRLGHLQQALESYQKALRLRPNMIEALSGSADVLLKQHRLEEALEVFTRLLPLRPGEPSTLLERGLVLYELKRYQQAIADFDAAWLLDPRSTLARFYRGNAWLSLKQYERALADFEALLQVEPQRAETHCNRAHSLLSLARYEAALAGFEVALRLEPDLAVAADGRGMVLRALQRYEEALTAFDEALAIAPQSADALYRRALTLRDLERHEQAAEAFAEVIRVAPDYAYALGNLVHERLLVCDWTDYDDTVARITRAVTDGQAACPPGAFLSIYDSPAAQLTCARTYIADKHPAPSAATQPPRFRHDRLCIAYVSADFRQHPVAQLLAGVFERHDLERFETIAISLGSDDGSALARRVRGAFKQFIDLSSASDHEAVSLMRELEVDIAVDLTGLSSQSRPDLFAQRAAALQVNFLGYPGTLGTSYHDYIVADRNVIPEADREFFTERVAYLPHCFQPNDDRRVIAEVTPSRQQCGLPERGFVFCCFNRQYKINPTLFDIWMRLLRRVDDSVIWLSSSSPIAMRNLRAAAEQRGVDPARLVFAGWVADSAEHLARYRLADLFLDTLPFNAHTTASDALWAGVPVLTCQGQSYAARVSASLLTTLECPELITHSLSQYEALAAEVAQSPALATALRTRVSANRSSTPLFDTQRYCRDLESLYVGMWERAQRGLPPEHFGVPHTQP